MRIKIIEKLDALADKMEQKVVTYNQTLQKLEDDDDDFGE